jgi:hypothetical protein
MKVVLVREKEEMLLSNIKIPEEKKKDKKLILKQIKDKKKPPYTQ